MISTDNMPPAVSKNHVKVYSKNDRRTITTFCFIIRIMTMCFSHNVLILVWITGSSGWRWPSRFHDSSKNCPRDRRKLRRSIWIRVWQQNDTTFGIGRRWRPSILWRAYQGYKCLISLNYNYFGNLRFYPWYSTAHTI